MLQTVSMKDLNDTFTDFNTYTIIDFMEDLIKYGLVPEFIDTSNKINSMTIDSSLCYYTTLTNKTTITDCDTKYVFKDKYLSDGNYKKNTFKEFILFMHKKLQNFNAEIDIKQILKNEYENNICLDDETYITISNFYNIFKSLATTKDKSVPNNKFTTFQDVEHNRLKIVGKYDIARFNEEFKTELENEILNNINIDPTEKKTIMSKVLKGHNPFDFNVLMYYFYDISQEEEYLTTFVSFIVRSESEQDKLMEQLVKQNLDVNSIHQLSEDYVSFEFEIDNSNSFQTINLLRRSFDNIVVVTKQESNILLNLKDSEYQEKINAIKQKFGSSVTINKIDSINVDMTIILTEQELTKIKSDASLKDKIFVKELEKNYSVDLTAILDNSQRDTILVNYPETQFTEIGKEKLQLIIKSSKDRDTLQTELQSKFPYMNINVNVTNHSPSSLFQIQTDYNSAIEIKKKYGNDAMIKFNLEFIVPTTISRDELHSLTIQPKSIIETPPINLQGGSLNEPKLYILQTINKNKGSNRLKHASFNLSNLFSNLNYKVKYIDILMNNNKGNNKLLKKTRKRRVKKIRGGGATKKYVIKFAVDDQVNNSYSILLELINVLNIEPKNITVIGVENNSNFKTNLQKLINQDTELPTDAKTRFKTDNGFISETRKDEIFAESKAAQAKKNEEETIKDIVNTHDPLNTRLEQLLDLSNVSDSDDD